MAAAPRWMASASLLLAALSPLLVGGITLRGTVTPVEKVIQLLGRLSTQITEEGHKEAVEYDKFACFCKDQADQKTYAIEKSEKKIEELTATIAKLDSEITELALEIKELGDRITEIGTEVQTETDARTKAHEQYVKEEQDVANAIKAVEGAIEALRASKEQLTGDAKADLLQLQRVAGRALLAISSVRVAVQPAAQEGLSALTSMLAVAQPGTAHAYQYSSNDIIATLQALETRFKESKKTLDQEEMEAQAASDKKVLGLSNEKKFKEQSKLEKEGVSAKKSEEKHDADQEKTEETDAKTADEGFRAELATQCEAKATEFDQRSKSRASEITAIAEATDLLKSGVEPNYSANKKLTGLVSKSVAVAPRAPATPAARGAVPHGSPLAFLQVRRADSEQVVVVRRVLSQLGAVASHLNSVQLTALVSRMEMQEDHFVKVRQLISDLISKLQSEADAEATQKTFCDTEMKKAIENRDKQSLDIEAQTATITGEEAKKAKLLEDISTLSNEIAELNKALKEASDLRAVEKADNKKTIDDATAGKAAVEEAITVLSAYYGAGLLQSGRRGGQSPKDRDGSTISDLAPETTYSGEYHGNQDASKGIMGLLNVILSDFERTISAVTDQESAAQTAFETFEADTKKSVTGKEEQVTTKEGEVKTAEEAIVTAKEALKTAEGLKEAALKELENLTTMCVEGEESFEERKAKREQEVAALKEALKILEDWKA